MGSAADPQSPSAANGKRRAMPAKVSGSQGPDAMAEATAALGAVESASAQNAGPGQARHVELILRQIDALPTLPAIATRLLSLTASDESDAREVMQLVSADPSLTAKVLAMCRRAHHGVRQEALTVEKAVVLLGFNAIRSAVLSIKVFEVFEEAEQASAPEASVTDRLLGQSRARFETKEFWRHSLAVAVAAELIASAHPGQRDLQPGEAFVCGLLHDMGKLALYHVLPKAYTRVVELVEAKQGAISDFEKRIVGLDHHMAGKRLAEQWQLPAQIRDCIWLHGSPYHTLPKIEHRRLIGLVNLADQMVRRQHLGYSGNFSFREDPRDLAEQLGLNHNAVIESTVSLHEQVRARGEALGLDDEASLDSYMQSIQRANDMLGRLNGMLDEKSRRAARHARLLDSITKFHEMAPMGDSVVPVLGAVARSASSLLGEGFYAGVFQQESGEPWQLYHFDAAGDVTHSQMLAPPQEWDSLGGMEPGQVTAVGMGNLLPWLTEELDGHCDKSALRMMTLPGNGTEGGTSALLLHDRSNIPSVSELTPVMLTWGASVAAAVQHERAKMLGEELAETNRALTDAQDQLLRQQSMARLGEMAAGAAHEMNNPLAVICGRAQLLGMALQPGSDEHRAAETIIDQGHRLSDLISALSEYASAPDPVKEPADLNVLLDDVVRRARLSAQNESRDPRNVKPINLQIQGDLPTASVDTKQVSSALRELLANAVQSNPKTGVTVSVRHRAADDALVVHVADDGIGMDEKTLQHAFDPFFSKKAAGRRIGMGLPLARQLAMGHGGQIELRSAEGEGSVASLTLPLSAPQH